MSNFLRIAVNVLETRIAFLFNFYVRCRARVTDYLRLEGVRIGQGCSVYTSLQNFGTEPWLIEIGNNVTIGQDVMFITHDGTSRIFREDFAEMSQFGNRFGTIVIHDNCFIGNGAILLPGIEIGAYSAVGAGSVVTKSVPPRTIVAGNPARPIKTLDEYIASYRQRMIPLQAANRDALRKELTIKLWGQER